MTNIPWVTATSFVVLSVCLSAAFHPAPKLIWNASASAPIGLYAVQSTGKLYTGELVVVTPPKALQAFLDARGYLPKGLPLLKYVAALGDQTVCRIGRTVMIEGTIIGESLDRDHLGRPLPTWRGCLVIQTGEVFLMNSRSKASLDSRYFGPLATKQIIGRAIPLWTRVPS